MALKFDRAGFGGGLMKLNFNWTHPSEGAKVSTFTLTADKHGTDVSFSMPQEEAACKAKYPNWFLTNAEHATRKTERVNAKANKKKRSF